MSLSIGIVGLPNVGKSTLFNALTRNNVLAANYPFATIEPNTGVVPVPDPRLEQLAELYHPEKIIPATVTFVDIAGLVAGAHKGEGLGNQFLAHIRETSAVAHVVRAFKDDDVQHVTAEIDPTKDTDHLMELLSSGLTAFSVEGEMGHRAVAVAVAKAMGRGWKPLWEGFQNYGSESREHLDGIAVDPYWQVHTTQLRQYTEPAASEFVLRKYLPSEGQHQAMKGFFASSSARETNNNYQYSMDGELQRVMRHAGQPPLTPVETFRQVAAAGQPIVFANGYNAQTPYEATHLVTHHVRSVHPTGEHSIKARRQAELSTVEPVSGQARDANPVNR